MLSICQNWFHVKSWYVSDTKSSYQSQSGPLRKYKLNQAPAIFPKTESLSRCLVGLSNDFTQFSTTTHYRQSRGLLRNSYYFSWNHWLAVKLLGSSKNHIFSWNHLFAAEVDILSSLKFHIFFRDIICLPIWHIFPRSHRLEKSTFFSWVHLFANLMRFSRSHRLERSTFFRDFICLPICHTSPRSLRLEKSKFFSWIHL